MTMRPLVAAAALMAVIAPFATTAFAQKGEYMGWRIDGERRRAIVYAPSKPSPGGKAPLVLSFHGRGDTAENFQYTDMHRAWPEAVVAYFDGVAHDSLMSGWQTEPGQNEDRDLKLVDAALASLQKRFAIDASRIYATGFSNGAGFTYLLWSARPGVFTAFAPVAGRLRPAARLTEPRPLIHIVGEADRGMFAGLKDAVTAALAANGLDPRGEPCGEGCTLYGASSATPVMTWVHPGGHDYPDGISQRIARFLQQLSRNR